MPIGYSFIYNGTSSDNYNASLVFLDESYTNRPSGSYKELITTSIRRNPRKIYLDTEYSEVLTFNVEIVLDQATDAYSFARFKDWLFNPIRYAQLRILAENFADFYFNCVFIPNEDLIYNGGYRGVSAQVQCDAPWAWQNESVIRYDLSTTQENHITFVNTSASNEPLKPKITFHMASAGDFSIRYIHYDENKFMVKNMQGIILANNINYQDAVIICQYNNLPPSCIEMAMVLDKTMSFTGLLANKTITLDNELGILTQDDDINIIDKFNKVFLKFPQGSSELTVTGKADYIYFSFVNAIRFGGGYY